MQAGNFALTYTALETRDRKGRVTARVPLETIRGIALDRAEPPLDWADYVLFLLTGLMSLGMFPLAWAIWRRCDCLIVDTETGRVVLPLGKTSPEALVQMLTQTGLPVVAYGTLCQRQLM